MQYKKQIKTTETFIVKEENTMQYLEITIHDNDYYSEFSALGDYLSSFIRDYLRFHKFDIDIQVLKDGILKFLIGSNATSFEFTHGTPENYASYVDYINRISKYFEEELEIKIVDESEIDFEEYEDDEYLYIPICTKEELENTKYGVIYFFR